MRALDVVVSAIFAASTGGVLLFRTVRAWRRFRLQERTTELLVQGVRILEAPNQPATKRAPIKRDKTR